MPRRRLAHIGAALALSAVLSCHSYVEGNGVYYEEDRTAQLGAFAGLRVEDGIQGKVTVGTPTRVVVSGDSNLVKSISTVVVGLGDGVTSVLDVKVNLESFTPMLPLGVTVTVPEIRYLAATDVSRIEASGAGTDPGVTFQVIAGDGSNVTLSGPGGESLDLVLSGGTHGGSRLDARSYPVSLQTSVALGGSSTALVRSEGIVTGTAEPGSVIENYGAGTCAVTEPGGALVSCEPR